MPSRTQEENVLVTVNQVTQEQTPRCREPISYCSLGKRMTGSLCSGRARHGIALQQKAAKIVPGTPSCSEHWGSTAKLGVRPLFVVVAGHNGRELDRTHGVVVDEQAHVREAGALLRRHIEHNRSEAVCDVIDEVAGRAARCWQRRGRHGLQELGVQGIVT